MRSPCAIANFTSRVASTNFCVRNRASIDRRGEFFQSLDVVSIDNNGLRRGDEVCNVGRDQRAVVQQRGNFAAINFQSIDAIGHHANRLHGRQRRDLVRSSPATTHRTRQSETRQRIDPRDRFIKTADRLGHSFGIVCDERDRLLPRADAVALPRKHTAARARAICQLPACTARIDSSAKTRSVRCSLSLPSKITGPCTAKSGERWPVAVARLDVAAAGEIEAHPHPASFFFGERAQLHRVGERHRFAADAPRRREFSSAARWPAAASIIARSRRRLSRRCECGRKRKAFLSSPAVKRARRVAPAKPRARRGGAYANFVLTFAAAEQFAHRQSC